MIHHSETDSGTVWEFEDGTRATVCYGPWRLGEVRGDVSDTISWHGRAYGRTPALGYDADGRPRRDTDGWVPLVHERAPVVVVRGRPVER